MIAVFGREISNLLSGPTSGTTTNPTTPAGTTSSTTSNRSTSSPNTDTGASQRFANRIANILQAHGVTKRGFVDYGGFDISSSTFPSIQNAVETYAKYGFLVFPYIDISEGPQNIAQSISQAIPFLKQVGGGVLGPTTTAMPPFMNARLRELSFVLPRGKSLNLLLTNN